MIFGRLLMINQQDIDKIVLSLTRKYYHLHDYFGSVDDMKQELYVFIYKTIDILQQQERHNKICIAYLYVCTKYRIFSMCKRLQKEANAVRDFLATKNFTAIYDDNDEFIGLEAIEEQTALDIFIDTLDLKDHQQNSKLYQLFMDKTIDEYKALGLLKKELESAI